MVVEWIWILSIQTLYQFLLISLLINLDLFFKDFVILFPLFI